MSRSHIRNNDKHCDSAQDDIALCFCLLTCVLTPAPRPSSASVNITLYEPQIFQPHLPDAEDIAKFHGEDYVSFLQNVAPENQEQVSADLKAYGLAADCPIFEGLYNYCQVLYCRGALQ